MYNVKVGDQNEPIRSFDTKPDIKPGQYVKTRRKLFSARSLARTMIFFHYWNVHRSDTLDTREYPGTTQVPWLYGYYPIYKISSIRYGFGTRYGSDAHYGSYTRHHLDTS